jgi:histidyl-tRNA synthetase
MNKVEPKTLPGFMELLPQDQIKFNKMYDTIRKVYEKFGFLPLDTPILEYSEVLLAKAGGETEKQIFRFMKGDTDLSMRFDLTVPLARYVSQRYNDLSFPFKRYQMSKVFRGERPQKGRYREFYQCDIDIIGNETLDIIYDAEIPTIIYQVFKELNIGDFVIKMNNRKVLNGFFASLNLSDKITDILRTIDKIDKIGKEAVNEELIKFGVSEADSKAILDFIAITGSNSEILAKLDELNIKNEVFLEGVSELKQVVEYLKAFGVPETNFNINLTIARGLDYYTGTVYETNLVKYPELGSICSGGRYENLTEYYTNQKLPGIGISIGLTRLFSQLKEIGILDEAEENKSITKVLVMDIGNQDFAYMLNVATAFRNSDIPTDVYYGDKGMKPKMKYANKLSIPYVAIIGEDEVKNNTISLKNMFTGEQETVSVEKAIEIVKS